MTHSHLPRLFLLTLFLTSLGCNISPEDVDLCYITNCSLPIADSDAGTDGWQPHSSAERISTMVVSRHNNFDENIKYTHTRTYSDISPALYLTEEGQIFTNIEVSFNQSTGDVNANFCVGFIGKEFIMANQLTLDFRNESFISELTPRRETDLYRGEQRAVEFECLPFTFDNDLFHVIDSLSASGSQIALLGDAGTRDRYVGVQEKYRFRDMLSLMFYLENGLGF